MGTEMASCKVSQTCQALLKVRLVIVVIVYLKLKQALIIILVKCSEVLSYSFCLHYESKWANGVL